MYCAPIFFVALTGQKGNWDLVMATETAKLLNANKTPLLLFRVERFVRRFLPMA